MRRLSSTLITFALIAQPISTFAFYQTPGELVQAVQFDASAKTVKGEIHASNGTFFISAWMDGVMEGSSMTDIKMNANATVDVEETTSHMKGRFKGAVIIVDGQAFVKIDTIQGTFEDEALLSNINVAVKRWVVLPIDADMLKQIQQQILDETAGNADLADQLYDFHHTPYQYGNSYTLTLKPDVLNGITGQDETSSMKPLSESLVVKIDTNYKDEVQVQQLTLSMSIDGFSLTAQSKAQKMKNPAKVSAPTDAVTMDWMMQHIDALGSSFSLLQGLNLPDSLPSLGDQSSSSSDSSTSPFSTIAPSSGSEDTSTVRRRVTKPVKIINRVNPGITKPSRRVLEQQGNTNRK